MRIKINGKEETVERVSNISELVSCRKLSPEKIVVEHNLRIVPREAWPQSSLKEDDSIEIISFVGGG